jgi:hypothetical protein
VNPPLTSLTEHIGDVRVGRHITDTGGIPLPRVRDKVLLERIIGSTGVVDTFSGRAHLFLVILVTKDLTTVYDCVYQQGGYTNRLSYIYLLHQSGIAQTHSCMVYTLYTI